MECVGMSGVLTTRQKRALQKLSFDHKEFVVKGELPAGIGLGTMDRLVELGLAEKGPSQRRRGQIGWRITDDGWRCMYGHTADEIAKGDAMVAPRRVWR
jgi:hypothetical protein